MPTRKPKADEVDEVEQDEVVAEEVDRGPGPDQAVTVYSKWKADR